MGGEFRVKGDPRGEGEGEGEMGVPFNPMGGVTPPEVTLAKPQPQPNLRTPRKGKSWKLSPPQTILIAI